MMCADRTGVCRGGYGWESLPQSGFVRTELVAGDGLDRHVLVGSEEMSHKGRRIDLQDFPACYFIFCLSPSNDIAQGK